MRAPLRNSSTTIDPETEIVLQRLDKLPSGGASISFQQEVGLTWNRVERLVDPSSRFETTTASAVAFVRGTDYTVRVDASQQTVVEVVTGVVSVEAAGVTVVVAAGFQTTVSPGLPPTPPQPASPSRFGLLIEIQGPVRPFLVDDRNRSVGFQPEADAFGNQVPGARYGFSEGGQSLNIPNPTSPTS